MAWTSYELIDALELCDRLEDSTNQRFCYSGDFMENIVGGLAGTMGHYTEFVSDDPHFPCNILEEKYVPIVLLLPVLTHGPDIRRRLHEGCGSLCRSPSGIPLRVLPEHGKRRGRHHPRKPGPSD